MEYLLLCFVVKQTKQLEHSSSASAQKKHPYGLNVTSSHGNTVERTDWWELLSYLKQLDPSKLEGVLTILSSYDVKVKDIITRFII